MTRNILTILLLLLLSVSSSIHAQTMTQAEQLGYKGEVKMVSEITIQDNFEFWTGYYFSEKGELTCMKFGIPGDTTVQLYTHGKDSYDKTLTIIRANGEKEVISYERSTSGDTIILKEDNEAMEAMIRTYYLNDFMVKETYSYYSNEVITTTVKYNQQRWPIEYSAFLNNEKPTISTVKYLKTDDKGNWTVCVMSSGAEEVIMGNKKRTITYYR